MESQKAYEKMFSIPHHKGNEDQNHNEREPAVSVMAMSLDSHVVDRSLRPGPSGLKLTPGVCACVPKIPRGEWRRRDCGVAIPRGG